MSSVHFLRRQRRFVLGEYASGSSVTHPIVISWVARVVANGGSTPSVATQNALSTFVYSLDAANLTSKMRMVWVPVTDGLTATLTPLIKAYGGTGTQLCLDPFTNDGPFVTGDISVNGLTGNGSTKALYTGFLGTSFNNSSSVGIAVYAYAQVTASFNDDCGYTNDTGSDAISLRTWDTSPTSKAQFISADLTQGSVVGNSPGTGYYCGSRTASNDSRMYYANSSNAHSQLFSTFTGGQGSLGAHTMMLFCLNHWNIADGNQFGTSGNTLSFVCFMDGITSSDSNNLFNAVQTLRKTLGGGFV